MRFAIQRHRADQLAVFCGIPQGQMARLPAGVGVDAAALLQRIQKGMLQAWMRARQRIPRGGGDIGDAVIHTNHAKLRADNQGCAVATDGRATR